MCCQNEMTYRTIKQREKVDKAIQCGRDIFEIYKTIDMVKTPEIKELFEIELAPRLQEIRHKLEEEI